MTRLISDGGTMTVGRRTASYTWGQFQVTLQEGLEQAKNLSDRMADGYIYRPDDAGKGRAELTFVRADARIDMNADRSDLEATLDGASRRTEGDVFYSREITGLGLARTRPGRDYDVGDMVDVLVWGKYLPLPVTALTLGDTPDDVRVQVGGQMLRDAEASRKRNSAIDVQIATEKRQRMKEAGALKQATAAAQATATTAQSTADSAVEDAAQLRDVLGGPGAADTTLLAQLAAINAQIQSQGGQAQPGLLPMYIAMNTRLWEQQQEINEQGRQFQSQQQQINEQARQFQAQATAVDAALAARQREIERVAVLTNHGAWYLTETFTLQKGKWYNFSFPGQRGTISGCKLGTLNEGGNFVRIESAGDWQLNARILFPAGDYVLGTVTTLRLVVMNADGTLKSAARTAGYNKASLETLSVSLTETLQVGDYFYVAGLADSTSGGGLWETQVGPEWTEISARQLSVI